MNRKYLGLMLAGTAAAVVAGSIGVAFGHQQTSTAAYSYYRAMMGQVDSGSMMTGNQSGSFMDGPAGYQWMMGGSAAPSWMRGSALPSYMTATSQDPGTVIGELFANAPGARVKPTRAAQLGTQTPSGATLSAAENRVTFTGYDDHLVVVMSPLGAPDETFRVAGLVNPTITVSSGSRVSIVVINADPAMAHGLDISAGDPSGWMPMMTATPAFTGAALWFLGSPTSAGMHVGTMTFTAGRPGIYRYLCPVPGHVQKGMFGSFVVTE